MTERVEQYRPMVEDVREDVGLTPEQVPTDVILALIHVESAGDAHAHRKRSRYYGLLQIATPYLYDALDYAGEPRRHARTLMGDPWESIRNTLRYMARYEARHGWNPDLMAAIHKSGAGSAKAIMSHIRQGMPVDEAIETAAREKGVPNALEYVNRFRRARARYIGTVSSHHGEVQS